jgi:hypothetical protein
MLYFLCVYLFIIGGDFGICIDSSKIFPLLKSIDLYNSHILSVPVSLFLISVIVSVCCCLLNRPCFTTWKTVAKIAVVRYVNGFLLILLATYLINSGFLSLSVSLFLPLSPSIFYALFSLCLSLHYNRR